MSNGTQKLEAFLFVAGEAVAKHELLALLNIEPRQLEQLITDLQSKYEASGLAIVVTDTHIELTTSPTVAEFLQHYLQDEPAPLTRAMSEVLALVAYRGPITRFDIDNIRGVDSRRTLETLYGRGYIQKRKEATKAWIYSVTPEFFKHLGITSKEELPEFSTLTKT